MELRFDDPGLEFNGLIFKLLPSGKVLLIPEGSSFHYTLHPGYESGVIDFHKTNEQVADKDSARYDTIAAIPKEELARSLCEVGEDPFVDLLKLFRPIRVGWIARRRLSVVAFPTENEMEGVSEIRIKAGPAECAELLGSWLRVPEFIDDIFQMPNTAFLLLDCRKKPAPLFGVLFKLPGLQGGSSLRWIRLRELRRWSRKMEAIYAPIFKRFLVNQISLG